MFIHINILCNIRGKIKVQIFSLAPDDNTHLYGEMEYHHLWPRFLTQFQSMACTAADSGPPPLECLCSNCSANCGYAWQLCTICYQFTKVSAIRHLWISLCMWGQIIMSCYSKADNHIYCYKLAWWLLIFPETSGSRNYAVTLYHICIYILVIYFLLIFTFFVAYSLNQILGKLCLIPTAVGTGNQIKIKSGHRFHINIRFWF